MGSMPGVIEWQNVVNAKQPYRTDDERTTSCYKTKSLAKAWTSDQTTSRIALAREQTPGLTPGTPESGGMQVKACATKRDQ
jgi:hypothetical protein